MAEGSAAGVVQALWWASVGGLLAALLVDSLLRAVYLALSWMPVSTLEPNPVHKGSLAVVVPAHNESATVGDSVGRLRADSAAGAVFVIADHCTDGTAAAARAAGAQVWERAGSVERGKGVALKWFSETARDELRGYDAVAVFDADSVVEEGFLRHCLAVLWGGVEAVQGYVQPLSGGSTAADLAAYSEILSQRIDDQARLRLGWPTPLRGTGMVFRREALQALAPRLKTKVEDVELSLLLATEGRTVHFVPQATVGDPKPTAARGVAAQRGRWLQGQAEVWRTYGREIFGLAWSGGPAMWSLLSALLLKPKAFVFVAKLLLSVAVWSLAFEPQGLNTLVDALTALMLGLDAMYYVVGLRFVEDRHRYASALLRAPLYVLVWLWSAAFALLTRETWLRARD